MWPWTIYPLYIVSSPVCPMGMMTNVMMIMLVSYSSSGDDDGDDDGTEEEEERKRTKKGTLMDYSED